MTGLSVFFSSRSPYFRRKADTDEPDCYPSSTSHASRHRFNHRRHFAHDSDNYNIILHRSSCVRRHRTCFEYDPLADTSRSSPDPHLPPLPDQQPSSFYQEGSHYMFANKSTEETLITNILVRPDDDGRLPGPVLLARQRLIEKLNGDGVCHSRNSEAESFLRAGEGDVILPTLHSSSSDGRHVRSRLLQSTTHQCKKWNMGSFLSDKIGCLKEKIVSGVRGKVTAPSECGICLEEEDKIGRGGEWTTLLCGHCFHLACLRPWLQVCGTCPYCRRSPCLGL